MEEWDDLRILLALVRKRTVRSAAEALRVNHTTVSRRLRAMEDRLGTRLVQRTPDGYRTTESGEVLYDAAERMETELLRAQQQVEGTGETIAGRIRINTSDLGVWLVGPTLARVGREHPDLELEISISSEVVDLARLDADLVFRLETSPDPNLIGRRTGKIMGAVYGARSLEPRPRPGLNLAELPWVRWQSQWRRSPFETYIDRTWPGSRAAVRVDSYNSAVSMVAAGAGLGVLDTTTIGHRDDLTPYTAPLPELAMDHWILIHPDLRGVRRVSLLVQEIARDLELASARDD